MHNTAKNQYITRLQEIACELQSAGKELISTSLPHEDIEILSDIDDAFFKLDNRNLHFKSVAVRNQLVADKYYADLIEKNENDPSVWFHTAREIWAKEIGCTDQASGRFLSLWGQEVDILAEATKIIRIPNTDVFEVLHVIQAALPHLSNIQSASLINLCDAQYDQTINDLAGGRLYVSIREHLQSDERLCRDLLNLLRERVKDTTRPLYTNAMLAYAFNDNNKAIEFAIEDIQSGNFELISSAIWAIAQLMVQDFVPEAMEEKMAQTLINTLRNSEGSLKERTIYAITSAVLKSDALAEILNTLIEQGESDPILALSDVYWRQYDEIKNHKHFKNWFLHMASTPVEMPGAIEKINYAIDDILKDGQCDLIVAFIEKWLINNNYQGPVNRNFCKLFYNFTNYLTNNKNWRSTLITKWLLSPHRQHIAAINALISEFELNKVTALCFDPDILDNLDRDDRILLMRRMLGVVYSNSSQISLTSSLLLAKKNPKEIQSLFQEVFQNEIGIDAPVEAIEKLTEIKNTTSEAAITALCQNTINHIQKYMDDIEALPHLKEIDVPYAWTKAFQRGKHRIMSKAMDEAQEESVIQQLVTKIPLKAGTGHFSNQFSQYPEASHLHAIEHTTHVPRRMTMDIVGYEFERFLYRNSTRGPE